MSTRFALTRRAALAAFGAFAGWLAVGARWRSPTSGSAVLWSMSAVARHPGRSDRRLGAAKRFPARSPSRLARYLAPGDRDGATLIARIDDLYLGPNGGTGLFGGSQDTINGTLVIKGPRGGVAAETPIRAITSYHQTPVDQPLRVEFKLLAGCLAGAGVRGLGAKRARALEA